MPFLRHCSNFNICFVLALNFFFIPRPIVLQRIIKIYVYIYFVSFLWPHSHSITFFIRFLPKVFKENVKILLIVRFPRNLHNLCDTFIYIQISFETKQQNVSKMLQISSYSFLCDLIPIPSPFQIVIVYIQPSKQWFVFVVARIPRISHSLFMVSDDHRME